MTQHEFAYWQAVTQNSKYRWVEDSITRRNGNGSLYYTGGEDGRYMHLSPEGKRPADTYEGAIPHVGEAMFKREAERQFPVSTAASPRSWRTWILRTLTPPPAKGKLAFPVNRGWVHGEPTGRSYSKETPIFGTKQIVGAF